MYRKKYRIHFVGMGGIGMSGIAELLLNLGYQVSGSDLKASEITRRLESIGGIFFEGHKGENIEGADVVVVSSAVPAENPELEAASAASVPVIPRAEMLAELMRLKYSIAVAGAHGKTTTTWLVASVLARGGLDPTLVVGGRLKSIGTNALLGRGDFIVAEADESDGSFLKFSPSIAVVTNIDLEHLDFYRDLDHIKESFLTFIDRIPFYGLAILCLDNEAVQDLIPHIKKRYATYGLSTQADFQVKDIHFAGLQSRFSVFRDGEEMGQVLLNLPGMHNVMNALASIAVGTELNIPFPTIRDALENIEGVQRRLELKGQKNGIQVVDDYGHHPTEIRATLEAAKKSWPDRRLVVVFQPHRYSRTRALFDAFSRSFYQSDKLVLLPIYSAGEKPIEECPTHDELCKAIHAHGHRDVICRESLDAAVDHILEVAKEGDILLTLGAGDVWKVGERFLDS